MKIYVMEKGLTMVGKSWEIRQKLKEYSKQFDTVEQWITANQDATVKKSGNKVIPLNQKIY
ncbi:Z-ring formation inhibitor MciZ [Bacillus sp. PS06]|nr:Z-ring formation inhibitor MciZ [Bacillus sp. PS06]